MVGKNGNSLYVKNNLKLKREKSACGTNPSSCQERMRDEPLRVVSSVKSSIF